MTDLRDLYQQVVLDHGRHPRNFGVCCSADHTKEGYNPLCGDRLTVTVVEKNGVIEDIMFEGTGCAISTASASLMTEAIKGKGVEDAHRLFEQFHTLVTTGDLVDAEKRLGKLVVLAGVSAFPARVKCATLAWHTLMGALNDEAGVVSTETD